MNAILPGVWDLAPPDAFVHCYLWQWDEGLTLIDTCLPGHHQAILEAIRQLGHSPQDVKRIVITHGDIDHMGSARALQRITGAPVACHAVEKAFLENPRQRKPSRTLAGLALRPFYALAHLLPRFRVEPVIPDQLLVDGEKLPEGLTVIHTPGHTPGHISLLDPERRILFTGDALHNRGGKLQPPPPIFTPDMDNAIRSIWKLAHKYGKQIDAALFGHGPPILHDAGERIRALADELYQADKR